MTPDSVLASTLSYSKDYQTLGLINSARPGTLTYLDSEAFLAEAVSNANISGIVTTTELAARILDKRPDVACFECKEPREVFFQAHNLRAERANSQLAESTIHDSARIHHTAFVDSVGVTIGPEAVIEPLVTILRGVHIGKGSIIRTGSRIGVEGFEHKRIPNGLLSVVHDGFVVIGSFVEIGANCTVARGLMGLNTTIGDHTKTDCLVHIAHGVRIGRRCLIPAAAMIAGSAIIEDDVWIGPNASISSQVSIGSGARITLGSVVVRDVPTHGHVTGNFAVPHRDFLRQFRNHSR
jgi:UDP-3-O-[3-hydroxymyristoyl] glucosamine N-acyltransferase